MNIKEKRQFIESLKIEPPTVPNFLRGNAMGNKIIVPIQEFTDDELKVVGKKFVSNLLKLARKKRTKTQ